MAASASAKTSTRGPKNTRTPRADITQPPASLPAAGVGIIAIEDGEPEEAEREAVFSIGDKVHTMLAHPSPTIAATAADLAYRRGGTDQAYGLAAVYVMREMLGESSYRALLNAKRLTKDQYKAIIKTVTERAYGVLEEEDGSPNS
jgi:hypothetical protein